MLKQDWQKLHGFDDEEMQRIENALTMFNGRITKIKDGKLDYDDLKIKMDLS